MDGFKKLPKMKTGGSVKSEAYCKGGKMKSGGEVKHDDIKEDKKIAKKAINLHDDQLHEGAKTDLSTLKKGGRCKKTGGTVRKYAAGGLIDAKGGKKPRPRPEPPGGVEPDDVPRAPEQAYKKGGKVKAMAVGGAIPMSMMSDQQLQQVQQNPASSPIAKIDAQGLQQMHGYIKNNPIAAQQAKQPLPPPQQVAQAPMNRTGLGAIGTGDMTQMAGVWIIAGA